MLNRLLFDEPLPEAQPALITRDRTTTWGELKQLAEAYSAQQAALAQRRIGLAFCSLAASYAALAALDRLQCDVFLFNGDRPAGDLLSAAKKLRLGAVWFAREDNSEVHGLEDEGSWSGATTLTILTSGSTGEPKAARHSWESISRPVRKMSCAEPPVWMLTYQPTLYAGLQVMLQCFADKGTLVSPGREMEPAMVASFMLANRVQFVSATASYWRRLLMFADHEILRQIPLQQITLGGEVVDQGVLDRLRACYPKARLVHIYATTELGRCFSVSDGRAGFPASYLETGLPDGTSLKLKEGELLIQSSNSMQGYDSLSAAKQSIDGWFATGDLIEVKDDRVFFVGRKSEMINVAGSKVYPLEVERVIRTVAGVFDVRVFGKSSSIAGELVACEIVPRQGQDPASVRASVIQACQANLTSYQQPRLIKLVDQIALSPAGKTLRSAN